jgi:hypothetical protein
VRFHLGAHVLTNLGSEGKRHQGHEGRILLVLLHLGSIVQEILHGTELCGAIGQSFTVDLHGINIPARQGDAPGLCDGVIQCTLKGLNYRAGIGQRYFDRYHVFSFMCLGLNIGCRDRGLLAQRSGRKQEEIGALRRFDFHDTLWCS